MSSEMKMKVVADENIPLIKEAFSEFGEVVTASGRKFTRELLGDASILLVRSITNVNQALLEGSSVKFVATATIGTDHVDLNYLRDNNIGFAYAPASNADSVGEYIVAAMLTLAKKKKMSLSEITLGIIGVGNVGSRVYRHACTLGIKCLLNDPPKKRLTQSDIYVSLEHVLDKADIITLHVPLITTGEDTTYRMVSHEFLGKMKQGAILINSSRGKVVDEKSLRAAHSRLGGLVLDVWETEPAISLETLRMTDICTPHIAGYSYDGKLRGTQMIYDAACAFFFRSPSWHIPEAITTEIIGEIDCTSSLDPLFDAVISAYPIMEDDKRLRLILEKDKAEQEKYFDELRKKYPRRDEFFHFIIKCKKEQSKLAILLSNLGFKVDVE
jgi:erythronate-4-phosphate dehydrogenase